MNQQQLTTIFYADDDLDDLDFFREVAAEISEPVTLFENGEKLLHQLHNPPPTASVIFLDLNMPVKSGIDVLKEIRKNPTIGHIPIVILTTSGNPDDIKLTKKLGASLYIRKPSSITALKQAVHHVLSIDWNNFAPTDSEFLYHK